MRSTPRPPSDSALSLATETMNHDYLYDLVGLKGGRYRGLQGRGVETSPTIGSDFEADVPHLRDLAWLHGDTP
ncbi:hypothetical protein KV100_07500 [Mumia sp. zg.B21]|uniref:hypothetical protein n=1 Tax=Mumia sp. zg.B21 TaxID=2855447 RepID=UPI001C6ED42E|nr:hypothetical protein [Mumia sp. zg.B21]MBW9209497.1 hypothetical protein [Mumia sp. zg.B21]